MKAISLWQPWASFMAAGMKLNETRSWCTGHRGDLVIHAAQKRLKPHELPEILAYWMRRLPGAAPSEHPLAMDIYLALPYGAALCVINLDDCIPTHHFHDLIPAHLEAKERDMGDYTPGRWAWRTSNLRRLTEPVPLRGRQSMWTLSAEEEQAVRQLLPR